ncbi:unnamed protein product [Schistocephalus solidus]|uniref:Transmembrane protein n=2 Tax=Schistocephalus solidus TaxID=70667 RepID=A0A183SIS1_SCHSO|nr:unnamed protein product [Schistocephalus solidus]
MGTDSLSSVREKRRTRARRRLSAQADKLLLFLHSLFPFSVYAVLIYQQFLLTETSAVENTVFAGYWVGGMGILLQLSLISWPILPNSELLLFSFAAIEAACALIGGIMTLVWDRKQHFIGGVSLASVVFTILPMYLTITSLRYTSKSRKEETEVHEKFNRDDSDLF